jgi:hypothetical protein
MFISILSLIGLAAAVPETHKLFCYWESDYQFLTSDYVNELNEVPIKTSLQPGCDVVIILDCDYNIYTDPDGNPLFGYINEQLASDSTKYGFDKLKADVQALHAQGGKVYVSLGAYNALPTDVFHTDAEADDFIDDLIVALKAYGIDGVEFNQQLYDSGSEHVVVRMIKRLKSKYSHCEIMYTFSATNSYFSPWLTVLKKAGSKLDYVQIYGFQFGTQGYGNYIPGWDLYVELDNLEDLKVSNCKVVIGVLPCENDAAHPFPDTLYTTVQITQKVKDEGYKGIGLVTAKRDTDSREWFYWCPYITGYPSGTYIEAISNHLSS